MTCPICGGDQTTGCRFTKTLLSDDPLSADDWREVWMFIRFVQLPFLHLITARARARLPKPMPPLKPSEVEHWLREPIRMKRVECPECGEMVASNWYVRHMKREHPQP